EGATVVEGNVRAFQAGLEFAEAHPLKKDRRLAPAQAAQGGKMLTDGNDICAAAAIFAGCTFFSGYPITPSTEIMQFFDREVWKYGGAALQAGDEIACLCAGGWAAFPGQKAMTATPGPGLSPNTEMLRVTGIYQL